MKKNGFQTAFFTFGAAGLFLAGFCLLVTLGAKTYRDAVTGQLQNNNIRALRGYLSTSLKQNDTAGALSFYEDETGPVLVIADGQSGYATRIYQQEGQLLEDYAKKDAPLSPDMATAIGETETFCIERSEKGYLVVTTDAGSVILQNRSGGNQ